MIIEAALAFAATVGFCILFRVPLKRMPVCGFVGAAGWVAYQIMLTTFGSPVVACFVASCIVGILSNIASHIFKDAATIFIIPGILCLVPGLKLYTTVLEMLDHDFSKTAETGLQTLMMAGAIALGLLCVGAFFSIMLSIKQKTSDIFDRF